MRIELDLIFDTPMGDEKIIKELLRLYGDDAGVEAAEFFRQYWTIDRIHNHSVPALILHEIQALNHLNAKEVLALGLKMELKIKMYSTR